MSNLFDPNKLNLDLDNLDEEEKSEKSVFEWQEKEDISSTKIIQDDKENEKDVLSDDYKKVNNVSDDLLPELDKKEEKQEKKEDVVVEENASDNVEIDLTEREDVTLKKKIIDKALNWLDDLILSCKEWNYDHFIVVPEAKEVRVDFRNWDKVELTKHIPFMVYSKILIKAKTLWKLDIELDSSEQKWEWKTRIEWNDFKVFVKTVPSEYWEKFYFKPKLLVEKKWWKKKNSVSWTQLLTFMSVVTLIVLLLSWGFMAFIVFNAQSPQDVEIFRQLWINVWEINRFIKSTIAIIFWILLFVQSIFLSIFIFRAALTKKIYKRKKTVATVVSFLLLLWMLLTASLWFTIYKKELPNWASLSRWSIQVFNNTKFVSDKFDVNQSFISDTSTLIWPITLRYDLTNYLDEKRKEGFYIDKFVWSVWEGSEVETLNPIFIKEFKDKWLYNISLNTIWTKWWEPHEEEVSWISPINISSAVIYEEEILPNSWKIVSFDASEFKNQWTIKWYIDSSEEPFNSYVFKPQKTFFEDTYVWMKLIINWEEKNSFDKIFLISWADSSDISWDIWYEVSKNNDLVYNLRVDNTQIKEWNWFVSKYEWIIWNDIITIDDIDVSSPESIADSSEIEYEFSEFWNVDVSVRIYDSVWNSSLVTEKIRVANIVWLKQPLTIKVDWEELPEKQALKSWNRYNLWIVENPSTLTLDARRVRSEDILYSLDSVSWDLDWDWSFDKVWKTIDYKLINDWIYEIMVEYKFIHRRDKEDISIIKEYIDFESIEKDAILNLEIIPDSEYVPSIVTFDASKSKVKWENIVKFIFDYWDWTNPENRDAVNKWHRYIEAWNYNVKLTVVTDKWNKYSLNKSLILKKESETVKISSSLKKAPVHQWIDFSSAESNWDIVRYLWNFWDWNKSRQANPTHFYSKPWIYEVTLSVDFSNNNTLSDTYKVVITQ